MVNIIKVIAIFAVIAAFVISLHKTFLRLTEFTRNTTPLYKARKLSGFVLKGYAVLLASTIVIWLLSSFLSPPFLNVLLLISLFLLATLLVIQFSLLFYALTNRIARSIAKSFITEPLNLTKNGFAMFCIALIITGPFLFGCFILKAWARSPNSEASDEKSRSALDGYSGAFSELPPSMRPVGTPDGQDGTRY